MVFGEGACFYPGPESCKLSDWGIWGTCTKTCGKGQHVRTRAVQELAENNQLGCGSNVNVEAHEESGACDLPACTAVDCKFSPWKEWDACDASCGGGSQKRSRAVANQPSDGGAGCSAEAKDQGPTKTRKFRVYVSF